MLLDDLSLKNFLRDSGPDGRIEETHQVPRTMGLGAGFDFALLIINKLACYFFIDIDRKYKPS